MATLSVTDVESLFAGMCQAWNRGDPDGVADYFTSDGRLVTPFGEEHDGLDEIRAGYRKNFQGLLAGTQTSVEIGSVRALAEGLAVVDATQTLSGQIGDLHLTLVVRQNGDRPHILEARPYVFLKRPA